jgi:hypothetical protein
MQHQASPAVACPSCQTLGRFECRACSTVSPSCSRWPTLFVVLPSRSCRQPSRCSFQSFMLLFEQTLLRAGLRWPLRSHARCHSLAPGPVACACTVSTATFRPVPQGRASRRRAAPRSQSVGPPLGGSSGLCISQPGPLVRVVVWRLAFKGKAMAFHEQRPNPSVNRTSNSGLRPPSAAGYLER